MARRVVPVVYPSRRNLPPRTRIVIEFLAELLCADPTMKDTEVGAASALEMAAPDKDSSEGAD